MLGGWELHHASKELRGDKEVVLKAVAQNGDAIGAASKTLRHDPEVAKVAAESSGKSVKEIEDHIEHLEKPETMARLPEEERWVLPD